LIQQHVATTLNVLDMCRLFRLVHELGYLDLHGDLSIQDVQVIVRRRHVGQRDGAVIEEASLLQGKHVHNVVHLLLQQGFASPAS
jgi:hypothetical protein